MFISKPDCMKCKKYNEHDYDKFSCSEYPDGIPDEILELNQECKKKDIKNDDE